jgi:D-alanyl-D-alanine carboxypeptidase
MLTTVLGRVTIAAIVALSFAAGIFLVALWSVHDAIYYEPALKVAYFSIDSVGAQSAIIFDQATGEVIAEKNSTAVRPIASVTKLLTAAMFYEHADLDATTSIAWSDVNTEGAAGRLHANEVYGYRELLFPLLLESSNDAASAMLRIEPDLLTQMRAYAASLGLSQTAFADPSGLSKENVSTASELAILARALYEREPHIFDITRLDLYIGTHTGWLNNDPMEKKEGFAGGKHGYTEEADRTGIAFFTEHLESGQDRTIGYVLLGSEDLSADIDALRAGVRSHVRME